MDNKELITTFIEKIVDGSFYDAKNKTGSSIYFLKFLKLIIADKNDQSLNLKFSDDITVKVYFDFKGFTPKPEVRYSINGNLVSRVINEVSDFTSFLSALPFSRDYFKVFNRDDDPKRTYNKIVISKAILNDVDKCDMISVSYENENIGCTLMEEVYFYAGVKPIDRKKFIVTKSFLDSKLDMFNQTPPKGKQLSSEDRRKVITNEYTRGIDAGYRKEVIVNSIQNVCEEINSFFNERYELLRMVRKKAGYIK